MVVLALLSGLRGLVGYAGEANETRIYVVNQNAPGAADNNPGTPEEPLKTIGAAAELAQPGDTVLVRAGIYREWVAPPRGGKKDAPIVYQAASNEHVFIRGSEVFAPQWDKLAGNLYAGRLDTVQFPGVNPFYRTISISSADKSTTARPVTDGALEETLGEVFVNGQPYLQVMSQHTLETTPGTWLVDAAGENLLLHFAPGEIDPAQQLVEITVRERIFSPYRRGLAHIHVRGFILEHCANQGPFPQNGALSVRSGNHWVIEGNTIRYAKTIGLDIGSEYWDAKAIAAAQPTNEDDMRLIIANNNLIINNTISDNGLCGIAGWNNNGTRIVGNTVERNNRLGFPHGKGWEEWGGIKLHASNALIAGNLVRDNEAHGIWIDNDYRNAHITRNVILNNLQSGIFLELGGNEPNCLVDNNVIGYTRSQGGFYNGNGIYTHDASNITIAHNLFFANAGFGVCMRVVSGRKFGGKPTGVFDEKILGNLFIGNNTGGISLPYDSGRSGNNISDYNYYAAGWGGEGKAEFYINKFQAPFDWPEVTAALEKKLADKEIAEKFWPNLKGWATFPLLHLEAWQALTGYDLNSVRTSDAEGKISVALRARQPELEFAGSDLLLHMKCPYIEDVSVDFYGNPIPADGGIPGPFQKLRLNKIILPLRNAVVDPQIRLTSQQKELRRQEEYLLRESKDIKKGGVGRRYHPDGKNEGIWFSACQPGNNPPYNGEITGIEPWMARPLFATSVAGVSRSPADLLLFVAPADAHYSYSARVRLLKRTAAGAGVASVQVLLLDAKADNARLLEEVMLNTPDGYRGKELSAEMTLKGEVAMRKGWYIALRFQIVSPGPAVAGNGNLEIAEMFVTER